MNKQKKFEEIKKEIEDLDDSPLYEFRKDNGYKFVVGDGSLDADVMFIGEAPGKTEAETGKPFVGQAGNVLDDLLKKAGLKRKDVYITSVLFDRPPKNRDPKKEEIQVYLPYLKELIELIEPQVIVTLGNFAIKTLSKEFYFSDDFDTLRMDHGKVIETKIDDKKVKVFPTYHPAAVFYNRTLQETIEQDFRDLKKII